VGEDPLLRELLSDTRAVVRRLLAEPLADPIALGRELAAAAERLEEAAETADLPVGRALAARCRDWLVRWTGLDTRGQRLVQVAVRYFALADDGEDDLRTVFGLDDDREVLDAVARALGDPPTEVP
jgi:hypothetical protein